MYIVLWVFFGELFCLLCIGVNTGGGTRGTRPPRNHYAGDANVIRPPRFWPLKTWTTAKFSPKIHQNPILSGLCPEPPGELTALPHHPPSWWGGSSLPPPQELHPRSQPFGLRASAFRASLRPPLFEPWLRLRSCVLYLSLVWRINMNINISSVPTSMHMQNQVDLKILTRLKLLICV